MIAVVTGGRDYDPTRGELIRFIDLLERLGVTTLRHGCARGVDTAASIEVHQALPGVTVEPWPANWKKHGKAAGPLRNKEMLVPRDLPRADVLVVFPGGRGTANCVEQARKAGGIKIYRLASGSSSTNETSSL